jgi:hypothetical protein
MLSETRDMAAAKAFFRGAVSAIGKIPRQVTSDGHDSYPRAIGEVPWSQSPEIVTTKQSGARRNQQVVTERNIIYVLTDKGRGFSPARSELSDCSRTTGIFQPALISYLLSGFTREDLIYFSWARHGH